MTQFTLKFILSIVGAAKDFVVTLDTHRIGAMMLVFMLMALAFLIWCWKQ